MSQDVARVTSRSEQLKRIVALDAAAVAFVWWQTGPLEPFAGGVQRLGEGRLTVGRHEDCDVRLDDPSVSRLHAHLEQIHGVWLYQDASSAHGTWLDGVRIVDRRLSHDDELLLGNTRLRFRDPSAATAGTALPHHMHPGAPAARTITEPTPALMRLLQTLDELARENPHGKVPSLAQMAARLHLAENTVKTQQRALAEHLGVTNDRNVILAQGRIVLLPGKGRS